MLWTLNEPEKLVCPNTTLTGGKPSLARSRKISRRMFVVPLAATSLRFANTVQLVTMSCADIIFQHGAPYYMKIDVEDATKICIDSLGGVADSFRPQLISAESLGFCSQAHVAIRKT